MRVEFYTSVAGSAFLRRLFQEWTERGMEVACVSALSETEYRQARSFAERLAVRWRMYGGHALACWQWARHGRRETAGIRVVTTNPFFAPALVARAAGGRGATVNLVYDLFPEALVQSGLIRRGSWSERLCANVTRSALRECAVTVFLGERLRSYAESALGPARRAVVVPVGADGTPFRNHAPVEAPVGSRARVLYSGQMGHMHDTETLLAAWRVGAATEVIWDFHASGPGYSRLRAGTGIPRGVTFGGPLAEPEWQDTMRRAAVALITIAPGAERVVMPSKTYSALVAGQAILAVCPRESDLADLVMRHGCGWVVSPGDVEGLRHAVREIALRPELLNAKRRNAFAAGHRYYDMTVVADTWMELFASLEQGSAPRREDVEPPAGPHRRRDADGVHR